MAERRPRRPPATTPEDREMQIAAKAYDLAEKQIEDGSAAAQVITHFLKAKSTREQIELAQIQGRIDLMNAQKEGLASAEKLVHLIEDGFAALRTYGVGPSNNDFSD